MYSTCKCVSETISVHACLQGPISAKGGGSGAKYEVLNDLDAKVSLGITQTVPRRNRGGVRVEPISGVILHVPTPTFASNY